MSRHNQPCLIALALGTLALCTTSASAGNNPLPIAVTVNVFNDAGVATAVVKGAELEAERILAGAHIQIRWKYCTPGEDKQETDTACRALPAPNHLSLRIVPGSAKGNDEVFGTAFLGADGMGTYSDVFYGSVERLHSQAHSNVGRVLGHVMAHEIGHLLIGSHAHSPWGIMSAKWHDQELQRLEMGRLLFTPEQEKSIYSRLHGGSPGTATKEADR